MSRALVKDDAYWERIRAIAADAPPMSREQIAVVVAEFRRAAEQPKGAVA